MVSEEPPAGTRPLGRLRHTNGYESFDDYAVPALIAHRSRAVISSDSIVDHAKRTLAVHTDMPLNAEPPPDQLGAHFLTPQHLFYIRTHGSIPLLDAATYRLRVGGSVKRPLELSLEDLRSRFARRSTTAVVQCAGNRRGELNDVSPVLGDLWGCAAIGNAEWTGVALADVLQEASPVGSDAADFHVAFTSYDEVEIDGNRFGFGASIPHHKAMSPEVLLALEVNGEPLAPQHGFPVRVIVPGYAGVRSVKWLREITVQDAPSDNYFQSHEYKLFPPDARADDADWDRGITIDAMPLTAAICDPLPDATVAAGRIEISGYAVASGREIARVDVSPDGGDTWQQAQLRRKNDAPWSWTLWQTTVELRRGERELVVRAWDCAGQTQPAFPKDVWNFKGYLNAASHRVRVVVA